MNTPTVHKRLITDGSAITDRMLALGDVDRMVAACHTLTTRASTPRAGIRDVAHELPEVADLAASHAVRDLVEQILGINAFVARSILFDKTPEANWDVVWHQDTTIAVAERLETPGFGPWSIKRGIVHVQPPAANLERMLIVRIHLDDCGPKNGPLLVVPGSHREGILPEQQIDPAACGRSAVPCHVNAGAAVLMRPLLLHASKRALVPTHRRVIHLEFASGDLPGGLSWARN